jgi:gas vesicle protein
MENTTSTSSGFLSGIVIGAVLGVLFAPKKGAELRGDMTDWTNRGREKTQDLYSKIKDMIPGQVKAAAAVGAVRDGGREAYREVKTKFGDFKS